MANDKREERYPRRDTTRDTTERARHLEEHSSFGYGSFNDESGERNRGGSGYEGEGRDTLNMSGYGSGYEARRKERLEGSHVGKGPKGYTRSDERLHEAVCERLSANSFLDASDIEIKVENAEVTLSGSVDSRRAKRLAEDIADAVSGVTDIHNRLRVHENSDSSRQGAANPVVKPDNEAS